jgi:hypothetical protein
MRLQIQLSTQLWEQVCAQAHREHRYPKQQIEFLLHQALMREPQIVTAREILPCHAPTPPAGGDEACL